VSAATIASNALLKMLYSSLVAGVGISLVFSVAILAAVRSSERRRDHRPNAAIAYGALAASALVASGAIVVYGVYLVAHKS
jgi:hypothetical protein